MKNIFATIVGSKLYDVATENSDTDFRGIGFTDISNIIGLNNQEQEQYKNDVPDGKDKIEGTCYDVKYFLRLAMKGNPTIIEVAFADPKFHIMTTPIGLEVCEFIKSNFLTKFLFRPYSAYHQAQIRKLQSVKPIGKRKELFDKYLYDLKFCFHSYRLARQCTIIMQEGILRPTLDPIDKEIGLNIRNGMYSKEQAIELLQKVDVEMYDAYKSTSLPEKPNFNKVNDFCVDIYKKYINGDYDSQLKEVEHKPNLLNQVTIHVETKPE